MLVNVSCIPHQERNFLENHASSGCPRPGCGAQSDREEAKFISNSSSQRINTSRAILVFLYSDKLITKKHVSFLLIQELPLQKRTFFYIDAFQNLRYNLLCKLHALILSYYCMHAVLTYDQIRNFSLKEDFSEHK